MYISDIKNTALGSVSSVYTQDAKKTTEEADKKSSTQTAEQKYDLVSEDGDTVEISSAAKMSLTQSETGYESKASAPAAKPTAASQENSDNDGEDEDYEDYSDLSQYTETELKQLVYEGHITRKEMEDELESRS